MSNRPAYLLHTVMVVCTIVVGIVLMVVLPRGEVMPPARQEATPLSSPQEQIGSNAQNVTDVTSLVARVYRFEEVVNLPPSEERRNLLRPLCSPEGFAGVDISSDEQTDAAALAGPVSFLADYIDSTYRIEPFDSFSVAVVSRIRLHKRQNGASTLLPPVSRISYWNLLDGTWLFVGQQFDGGGNE